MQFGWLIGAAVEWLSGVLRWLGSWDLRLLVGTAAAAPVSCAAIALRRRHQRWHARQAIIVEQVQGETVALKEQLRLRLSEPPQLFENHLNGAPTVGARAAVESDIEAAA